ncbi:MAG: DUF3105 domain-containing protein [Myxococcota bacterium]
MTLLLALACAEPSSKETADTGAPVAGEDTASRQCDACEGVCFADDTPAETSAHTEEDVDYPTDPPSSGLHDDCWAPWGVHTEPVPAEAWVHNLEHGGAVFLWSCEGCEEDLRVLESYVASRPEGRALMTPYPSMSWSFAVVSWEHRLLLGCFSFDEIDAFYEAHVGQAPEDVTAAPSDDCPDTGA